MFPLGAAIPFLFQWALGSDPAPIVMLVLHVFRRHP